MLRSVRNASKLEELDKLANQIGDAAGVIGYVLDSFIRSSCMSKNCLRRAYIESPIAAFDFLFMYAVASARCLVEVIEAFLPYRGRARAVQRA